ncbi:zinc finger BED domain-containing protein 5-like [Alosa pseudoharengus]|uniref:zinc finger BED domain-containing protein 5-like n=1 Tax=Alosa pseudoharengus TaxID=34774 RepID=UPI003F8BAD31
MDRWLKTGSVKRKAEETSNVSDEVNIESQGRPSLQQDLAQHSGTSCAKVKRKYHSDYIKFGFFWTGDAEDPKPHCVLCYDILANEAMKPAKLKRHLETKHKDYICKPVAFFERKCEELERHMRKEATHFFVPGENAKATEASYKVSLLIAKAGKPHSIGETLVKPAAKVMANIILGEKASDELTLSNDTVQRRITSMAENVQDQLVTRLRQSHLFSLQLDESTDIGNEAILLCFVRYIHAGAVVDDFLFCQSLPTNTTGEAIFESLNTFIVQNNIDWKRCVGVCTDGAAAMTAKHKGLVARVRAVAPSAASTHCCIHREQLASL